jgi:putative tricarboxylic transport membrane protein
MKFQLTRDRLTGIICGLLSLAYLYFATKIPATTMEGDPGPQVFPYIAGGIMLLSSISMLLRRPPKEKEAPWLSRPELKRMWGLFAIFVAYVVLLQYIGYTIPTFLVLTVMCLLFSRGRVQLKPWQAVLYSAVVTVVVFLLFTKLLGVVLPIGKFKALNLLANFM